MFVKSLYICILTILFAFFSCTKGEVDVKEEDNRSELQWELVWSNDFDYPDAQLEQQWNSQNGPNTHILCSRWRENAVLKDGVLHLENRKEYRGGQEWTSGSIWTKQTFLYGRFECRYKYGAANALNNSFWIMAGNDVPVRFEIDINEGKYPNKVDMNIHNHTEVITKADGTKSHPSNPLSYSPGADNIKPAYSFPLEQEIKTKKIRLVSNNAAHFHIREFRVFSKSASYPEPLNGNSSTLANLAKSAKVTCSGTYPDDYEQRKQENSIDGTITTSWVSQKEGQKYLQLEWSQEIGIGCIQFVNGWQSGGNWNGLISDYKVEYWDGTIWINIASYNVIDEGDFSNDFHVFALEWNSKELIWFLDSVEIRRESNVFCKYPAPVYLSSAIINWDGEVTDAIDGTSMDVDWVKIYQLK